MEKLILKTIKDAIKHWYIPLLVGLFFVIVSIVAFISPASSFLALAMLFSLSFLFGGLSEIIFAVTNRHELELGMVAGIWNSHFDCRYSIIY